jgi:hypothetical protein
MILQNREGHHEFNCEPDHTNRIPGLSALVRVKDEEDWVKLSLDSIQWADEIVITVNDCSDSTPEIVERFRRTHSDKVIVRDYPFQIHEMGPGHSDCPDDSVHASSYFYNFTQALSTRTHCIKWDGDIVAQDWFGARVRELMQQGHERIKIFGIDLASDLHHIGSHRVCPSNGTYRVRPGTKYVQGALTQSLRGVPLPTAEIHDCFLHMKWCKPFESAIKQWPEDWRKIPHFLKIAARRFPVAPYAGEYPSSVRAML